MELMRSNFILSTLYFLLSTFLFCSVSFAQEPSSPELVQRAWAASGQGNLQRLAELVGQCAALYGKDAQEQEKQLTGFPQRGQEEQYQALNSVATCLFIKAEAL